MGRATPFTKEDDARLAALAEYDEKKDWKKISVIMGFTPRQCRDRWVNYISCPEKPWTKEDDKLLVQLSVTIKSPSALTAFFPGRSRVQVRNRLEKMQRRLARDDYLLREWVRAVADPDYLKPKVQNKYLSRL